MPRVHIPIIKIWIHGVWTAKYRQPLIAHSIESKVYNFISHQLHELGCKVKIINGMPDHIYCLFLLNSQKSIAEVMKQVKGSSAHFINENNLIDDKFAWQTGYAAFSVSESIINRVYNYIKNQKQHHLKKSAQEEYEEYLRLFGL